MEKADIGLIGLGVMGQNLALNLANKGWKVVVWNRTVPGKEENVVEHFIARPSAPAKSPPAGRAYIRPTMPDKL